MGHRTVCEEGGLPSQGPASSHEGATEPTASASGLVDIILNNVLKREGRVSILF